MKKIFNLGKKVMMSNQKLELSRNKPILGNQKPALNKGDEKLQSFLKEKVENMEETKENPCGICLTYVRTHAFQCGHTSCHECAKLLVENKENCPVCRKEIANVIKLYLS